MGKDKQKKNNKNKKATKFPPRKKNRQFESVLWDSYKKRFGELLATATILFIFLTIIVTLDILYNFLEDYIDFEKLSEIIEFLKLLN